MAYRITEEEIKGMDILATGYKIFNNDWTGYGGYCYADEKGQVEGSIHKVDGDLKHCKNGLHFCKNPLDCMKFYPFVQWNKFAMVSAFGECKDHNDGKSEASILRIDKILSWDEFQNAMETVPKDLIEKECNIYGGRNIYGGSNISGGNNIYGGYLCKYIKKCEGIARSIFTYNKSGKLYLFNKKVTVKRFQEVWDHLEKLAGGWYPKFNNAFDLYQKNVEKWECVPAPMIQEKTDKEAYADMPKEMIEYVTQLPEFNAKIFKEITGIEV